jgi:hypothetical protein
MEWVGEWKDEHDNGRFIIIFTFTATPHVRVPVRSFVVSVRMIVVVSSCRCQLFFFFPREEHAPPSCCGTSFLLLPLTFLFSATARRTGFLWPRIAQAIMAQKSTGHVCLGPPPPSDREKCKYGEIASVCGMWFRSLIRDTECVGIDQKGTLDRLEPQGQEITGRGIRALVFDRPHQFIQTKKNKIGI